MKSFMAWDDVKNMLEEKVMTEDSLKNAWKEAAKGALIIPEINILTFKPQHYCARLLSILYCYN